MFNTKYYVEYCDSYLNAWTVMRAHSLKSIKKFETKEQALVYAKELALETSPSRITIIDKNKSITNKLVM